MEKILIILLFALLISCQTEVHKEYYSNGVLKEEFSLRNKKMVGEYKGYHENGNPQVMGQFNSGLMDGEWNYFYANGRRQSIEFYRQGRLIKCNYWDTTGIQILKDGNGIITTYYPSGKIKSKATYKNCKNHGKYESWFENGQKENEFYYDNGVASGLWKYWNEQGKLIKTESFRI